MAGVFFVLVATALAGAVIFRTELARAVLQNRLQAAGIEGADFRIAQVTSGSIVVAGFSSGDALMFDRLTVLFSVPAILRGRTERVELTGLNIDLTQPGPWSGFARDGEGGTGPAFDPGLLPEIELTAARVRFALPGGPATVEGSAKTRPANGGDLAFQTQLSFAGPSGRATLGYRGTIRPGTGGGGSATGDVVVDGENIHTGGLSAGRLAASLPIRVTATRGTVAIDFVRDAALSLSDIRQGGKPLVAALSAAISGRLGVSGLDDAAAGIVVSHELTIRPAPVAIAGPPATGATLGSIASSGTLAANGAWSGRVLIDSAHIVRGNQEVAATGIAVVAETRAGFASPAARITVGAVRRVSPAPDFGSFAVAATVRNTGDVLAWQAEIGGLGVKMLATVAGLHDLRRDEGNADLSIPDLALGPAGLWPIMAFPALKPVRNVTGRLGGEAHLTWRKEKHTGRATLRLDGIGGETDDAKIEGIRGVIDFDNLFPLSTAPAQILRIAKIDAGTVLTDASIWFALLSGGVIRIDRAEADVAGGKATLVAPAIDPVAGTAEATLRVTGVRLDRISALTRLEGFEATGRIDGVVPLRLAGEKIVIIGGRLAARGGGTLRLKSERAEQVLKTGGEQVGLMLRALEDFTYETLHLDLNKSLAGDAEVKLRTLGHNPAVLNGRKFQINVNLATNLDSLLAATLQWYRLSGKALRDIVRPETRERAR